MRIPSIIVTIVCSSALALQAWTLARVNQLSADVAVLKSEIRYLNRIR